MKPKSVASEDVVVVVVAEKVATNQVIFLFFEGWNSQSGFYDDTKTVLNLQKPCLSCLPCLPKAAGL